MFAMVRTVTCECGKILRFKGNAAGKGHCRHCGRIVIVPAADAVPPGSPSAPAPAPSAPAASAPVSSAPAPASQQPLRCVACGQENLAPEDAVTDFQGRVICKPCLARDVAKSSAPAPSPAGSSPRNNKLVLGAALAGVAALAVGITVFAMNRQSAAPQAAGTAGELRLPDFVAAKANASSVPPPPGPVEPTENRDPFATSRAPQHETSDAAATPDETMDAKPVAQSASRKPPRVRRPAADASAESGKPNDAAAAPADAADEQLAKSAAARSSGDDASDDPAPAQGADAGDAERAAQLASAAKSPDAAEKEPSIASEPPAEGDSPPDFPLLQAPFGEDAFHEAQQACRQKLGFLEVEFTNSIGTSLVLIPPGKYSSDRMTDDEWDQMMRNRPKTGTVDLRVPKRTTREWTVDKPYWIGRHEITQAEWTRVMGPAHTPWAPKMLLNGRYVPGRMYGNAASGPKLPASELKLKDVESFCDRLTALERKAGTLPANCRYTLPTEEQWEWACRGGSQTQYSFGNDDLDLFKYAWYQQNAVNNPASGPQAHPVGMKGPNPFGLYDMHGNIGEMCRTTWRWRGDRRSTPDEAEFQLSTCAVRGGCYRSDAFVCRSSCRSQFVSRDDASQETGFRIVCVVTDTADATPADSTPDETAVDGPVALVSPFSADAALRVQTAWGKQLGLEGREFTNSIGMSLVVVPPGEFEMHGYEEGRRLSQPKKITLQTPFFVGAYEVTVGQWNQVMDKHPWQSFPNNITLPPPNDNLPILFIGTNDAQMFCDKLSARERETGVLPPNWRYTLPTNAEWEYACRAGTTTPFSFGSDDVAFFDYGWAKDNTQHSAEGRPLPMNVGLKKPNAFGLHDMHGNLSEICFDSLPVAFADVGRRHGVSQKVAPVIRGGNYELDPRKCQSSSGSILQSAGSSQESIEGIVAQYIGFRVVCVPVDPAQELGTFTSVKPATASKKPGAQTKGTRRRKPSK